MDFSITKILDRYLDMESYGTNLIVKEYCHFPRFLPLPCHIEHGWTPMSTPLNSDLRIASYKKMMLVFNQRRKNIWLKASNIPVFVIGAPFVLYRQMRKIKQNPNAKGTIAFPSHSTLFIENQYDINTYCRQLAKLPPKYHPIDVCLFHLDIKKGKDKIYKKYGFKVVSAGSKIRGSLDFVRNFYSIICQYKFATSNEVGSYISYAVEMGLPFFLLGGKTKAVNKNLKDPNIGSVVTINSYKYGLTVHKLFNTGPVDKISSSQYKFVINELNIGKTIKPNILKQNLFQNTGLRYWLILAPAFWFFFCLVNLFHIILPENITYKIFIKLYK